MSVIPVTSDAISDRTSRQAQEYEENRRVDAIAVPCYRSAALPSRHRGVSVQMTNPIRSERRGALLELTIDRPKANAFDGPTSKALGEALVAYQNDDSLRCAIITGAGDKFFSGGWDLKAAAEVGGDESKIDYGPGGFAGITELWSLSKPVIAALNGMTIGGGWEVALACDMVVAADHVQFWMPEVQRGIIADGGAVQRLPRLLPSYIAMDILLTCRWVEVKEMQHYGLINAVVPGDKLMARARAGGADPEGGAARRAGHQGSLARHVPPLGARRLRDDARRRHSRMAAH